MRAGKAGQRFETSHKSYPSAVRVARELADAGHVPADQAHVWAALAEREAELGSEAMREVERQVMLRIIDQRWREHLEEMDYLQEGINLRAMGQKDPLTEWQREGFEMFEQLIETVGHEFVKYIMHVQVVVEDPADLAPACAIAGDAGAADSVGGMKGARATPRLVFGSSTNVTESSMAPRSAAMTVQAIGTNIFPSTPVSARTGT